MGATGPHFAAGSTIPGTRYQVVKSLGAGGMGIVYQVVKPPNIGGVLKLMSSDLKAHEEHRTRFFDEVRILAQLDHPNIVRVFDYDALPDGTPFYVMELLSGRTVRDVLETMGHVPPRVAYEITRQLLDALQCAHTHEVPVIHRDIKPENIFLHAPRHGEPVVKLIDFGVSAVADRQHDGAFVGTWSYAAPEQIRGEAPSAQTDLYAVALVLYEMLAGAGPFDKYIDWHDVSMAQLEEIPAPVSSFAPWVPASIVALIQAALAKDPRTRPRSAWEFAEKLYELEWANDSGSGTVVHKTVAGPSSVPPRVREKIRPDGEVSVSGSGPLAKVLTSIAAPPLPTRTGSTLKGVGQKKPQDNSTDALLDGLGGKRRASGRRSDPDFVSPSPTPLSARASSAETMEERLPSRDTFSSQSSDARGLPKSGGRIAMFVAAALLVFGSVFAVVLNVFGRAPSPSTQATAPTIPPAASTVLPSATPPLAASSAPAVTPALMATPSTIVAKPPAPKPVASPPPAPKPSASAPKKHSEFTDDF